MKRTAAIAFVALLTAIALYACYVLVRPYVEPILFAVVLAIVFHPLHVWWQRRLSSPSASALISTLVTLLISLLPLVFLALTISQELSELYRSFAAKSAVEGGITAYITHDLEKIVGWVGRHISLPPIDIRAVITARIEQASAWFVRISAGVVGNVFSLLADAVITFIVLFFLFRDGGRALAHVSSFLPLSEQQFATLRKRIDATVTANFYGGVAVGAAQGALTGLAFWVLGLESPILWGFVTAFFSLVPVIGSAAVWGTAAVVLLATGHWGKAFILLGWGVGVVGLIDNVVRPYIVSERVQLHTLYIFFALLGGVQAFGLIGLFVGPVIVSVTVALLEMLREELQPGVEPT